MSDLFAAFGVNWKLLLIQAVNFGLLLAALSYFLYKPILKIIDERRHKIAEGVRTAEAAAERLEEAEKEGGTMGGDAAEGGKEKKKKERGKRKGNTPGGGTPRKKKIFPPPPEAWGGGGREKT